jgi:hypothetical protein
LRKRDHQERILAYACDQGSRMLDGGDEEWIRAAVTDACEQGRGFWQKAASGASRELPCWAVRRGSRDAHTILNLHTASGTTINALISVRNMAMFSDKEE